MFFQASDVMPVQTDLPAIISSSAISVAIIQAMKNSDWPIFKAITQDSSGLNRFLAWFAAVIAGVGIHWHFDSSLGALTITGLTSQAIMSAAVNACKSYGFNWLIYNTAVKNRAADVAAVRSGVPVTPVASPGAVASAMDSPGKKD